MPQPKFSLSVSEYIGLLLIRGQARSLRREGRVLA